MKKKAKERERETTTSLSEKLSNDLSAKLEELNECYNNINYRLNSNKTKAFDDLTNNDIYKIHANIFMMCANSILVQQGKKFVVDDTNRNIIRFLLYYFNNCGLAMKIFPNSDYSLNKNILLVGDVGVGKTLIMDAFSLYLKETKNPRFFYSVSQTQLLNSYKLHNNIDKFIYNEEKSKNFEGEPMNLCLNDIGLQTTKYYGQDSQSVINELLYARYEIWATRGKFLHLTTNLDKNDIHQLFSDEFGRLNDRFKMYNVIPITGKSKR